MIKCPNCGAAINKLGAVVKCDYCGTSVRVQRRTGFFERVEPPVQLSKEALNLPLVVQKHTRRWLLFTMIIPVAIVGSMAVIGVFAVKDYRANHSPNTLRWDGVSGAVFKDIDGDGVADVIGRITTRTSKASLRLAAYSGANGKRLWKSEVLAVRNEAINTAMGLAETVVVLSDNNGQINAVKLADGALAWRVTFAERAKRFCAGGPDAVIVELDDKTQHRLSLADGSKTVLEPAPCQELPHDDPDSSGPGRVLLDTHGSDAETPDDKFFEGMNVRGAMRSGAFSVAFGNKTPGHRAPMLARYDVPTPAEGTPSPRELEELAKKAEGRERSRLRQAAHKARRELREVEPTIHWQVVVPGIPPLKAGQGAQEPEHMAINKTVVAAAYKLDGGGHNFRLTAFSLSDGKRLWDIKVPGTLPLSGVVISEEAVFVSRWGGLTAFDLQSGAEKWTAR